MSPTDILRVIMVPPGVRKICAITLQCDDGDLIVWARADPLEHIVVTPGHPVEIVLRRLPRAPEEQDPW
jgi:hypothetical protein